MKNSKIQAFMRAIHRDIGFVVIGITLIYALSGITLIYRDTDFLKKDKTIEKQLSANLNESELGQELRMRGFEVVKTEGDIVFFNNGKYNKSTGQVSYTIRTLPVFFEKINSLHKQKSKSPAHLFSTLYGILLLILAISSFWMFKAGTKKFKRGVILTIFGFIGAVIIIFI